MTTQKHPFHLVDPSPWPLVTATAAFMTATGFVLYIHNFSGGGSLFFFGFVFLLVSMGIWWRDIIREGTFEGQHSSIVQLGLRYGIILFIVSEVMFFFGFFWAFFWASLAPVPEIGSVWPPKGIEVLKAFEVPFLNTAILLLSGSSVTWAHHALVVGSKKESIVALAITVLLAIFFTLLQALEYYSASFTISDGIYGSTFFIATGFHGFHVLVGTCFLVVCFFRILAYHFTKQHHFGFEAAAWYWHFVDVVWLFLFVSIYWWGNSVLLCLTFFYISMVFNALEQFEIIALVNINLGFFDISISNATLFCFFSSFFILLGYQFISVTNQGFFIPTRFQVVYESIYSFVLNIVNEIIGNKGQSYFPFMLALFFFLLVANLIGIVPYSFTITSHVILTFTISLIIFVGRVFIGFSEHGLKYFGLLVPSGVPIAILPAFVIIEFLSFCIPLLALGVRLFANMISGHILLKVIVGFCWSIITAGGLMFLVHFLPIGVLFLLLFLETAVAIIQAYIFTILSCMYIGESVSGGH